MMTKWLAVLRDLGEKSQSRQICCHRPQSSSASRFTAGASDLAKVRAAWAAPGAWVKHSPPKRLRKHPQWRRLGSRIEYKIV